MDADLGKRIRATGVLAAVGSGVVMAVISIVALLALVLGDSVGMFGLFRALFAGGIVGAVGGALFAGSVSLLGRRKESDRLSYGSAIIAGASAAFLAPLLVGVVLFGPHPVPLLDIVLAYASDAWWLLGLGGAGGFVLNGLARGAFLRSGDEPEEITPGTSSLLEGDS
jgi:hypothetical protein